MEKVAAFFQKRSTFPQVNSDDRVSQVLGKVTSSHDPVSVYNSKGNLVGLVWPYKLLFSGRPQMTDKVGPYAVPPPQITPETSLYQAITCLLDNRVYALPVFARRGQILGELSARDILLRLAANRNWSEVVFKQVDITRPLVANSQATIRDIYSQLRQEKVSRVVLVDREGKITGIVGRKDIFLALLVPPAGKQRYSTTGDGQKEAAYDRDWEDKLDYPLSDLKSADRVVTAEVGENTGKILQKILASNKKSLVLLDRLRRPQGIVTWRSFLRAILAARPKKEVAVEIVNRDKSVDSYRLEEVADLVGEFSANVGRFTDIGRWRVVIETVSKNALGQVRQFALYLDMRLKSGQSISAVTKAFKIKDGVRQALTKIRARILKAKNR